MGHEREAEAFASLFDHEIAQRANYILFNLIEQIKSVFFIGRLPEHLFYLICPGGLVVKRF